MSTHGDEVKLHKLTKEEDVFEITDFTNSSDWEKFTSGIEDVISEWNLNMLIKYYILDGHEFATGEWETKNAKLSFAGVQFVITLHYLKEKEHIDQTFNDANEDDETVLLPQYVKDMMNENWDFPPRAHCLARWFGLRCFLILSLASGSGIASQSKSNLLASSVAIALQNTLCDIPFFVQIQENWRRVYAGHALSSGISSEFEMVHLKKTPSPYNHLSGLMNVFKSKIGLTSVMSGSTKVSARFTYILNNWGEAGKWPFKLPDSEALSTHFGSLMCGCFEDPVGELQLAATWPSMIGDMVIDNDIHTYFKPLTAPCWSIRLRYVDDVSFLLSSYLLEFLKLTDRSESLNDLLNVVHNEPEKHMSQALSKLTDPQTNLIPIVPTKLSSGITQVVSDPQALLRKGANTLGRIASIRERMPRSVLLDIKSFLFFEAPTDEESSIQQRSLAPFMHELCHKLKAAPINSLTYRLAMSALVVNMCHGGLPALAQLWHMFVSELRSLLDTGLLLPGIEGLQPDLKTCLLHQKLQMLNYCIHCKKQREISKIPGGSSSSFQSASDQQSNSDFNKLRVKKLETSSCDSNVNEDNNKDNFDSVDRNEQSEINSVSSKTNFSPGRASSYSIEDSDEEFFECETGDKEAVEEGCGDGTQASDLAQKLSLAEDNVEDLKSENQGVCVDLNLADHHHNPEGRLSRCGNLKLLHFDEDLFVPLTQDHPPMTEDLLEEQADVFSKLGDTSEGSKLRAKMQSASLISDMQAFKSANPGCCLEDFLRWYSPKDFENGKLSNRMQIPNNLWVTTWVAAQPVPISRQKRLFDDTKEAEKVLHFLTNLKPSEICQLLLPICLHEALIAISLVSQSMADCLPSLPLICNQIESKASHLFRVWKMHGAVSNQFVPWTESTRSIVNDLFTQISFAESLIERARSLRRKFARLGSEHDISGFIRKVFEHPEVKLEGAANGKEGSIIYSYFKQQQTKIHNAKTEELSSKKDSHQPIQHLPDPKGREFIIRASHSHPTAGSRQLPQRFYAVLMRNEFRLAAAVSSDTTFF